MVRFPIHDKHDHGAVEAAMPAEPRDSSQHARVMAQIAEAERRGSRVEARAVAHEGVGQRVGGLAGGDREDGGRTAGLGGARRLLAAALARDTTKHFRGPSGGRVEC